MIKHLINLFKPFKISIESLNPNKAFSLIGSLVNQNFRLLIWTFWSTNSHLAFQSFTNKLEQSFLGLLHMYFLVYIIIF
jgi:hypothetical protein